MYYSTFKAESSSHAKSKQVSKLGILKRHWGTLTIVIICSDQAICVRNRFVSTVPDGGKGQQRRRKLTAPRRSPG